MDKEDLIRLSSASFMGVGAKNGAKPTGPARRKSLNRKEKTKKEEGTHLLAISNAWKLRLAEKDVSEVQKKYQECPRIRVTLPRDGRRYSNNREQ